MYSFSSSVHNGSYSLIYYFLFLLFVYSCFDAGSINIAYYSSLKNIKLRAIDYVLLPKPQLLFYLHCLFFISFNELEINVLVMLESLVLNISHIYFFRDKYSEFSMYSGKLSIISWHYSLIHLSITFDPSSSNW